MGLSSLPLLFLLAAAPPLEAVPVPPVALPMTLEVFEAVLEEGDLEIIAEHQFKSTTSRAAAFDLWDTMA